MAERDFHVAGTEAAANYPTTGFSDRRREPRFVLDAIPARVRLDSGWLSARVLDISNSGMKLELETSLPVPAEATVCFRNIIAIGQICYCRRNSNEAFDVGLQLQDVINTA